MEILVAWGDKMSDKKTSDLIAALLTAFSESISPGLIENLDCPNTLRTHSLTLSLSLSLSLSVSLCLSLSLCHSQASLSNR
jgi:hypothetical protein